MKGLYTSTTSVTLLPSKPPAATSFPPIDTRLKFDLLVPMLATFTQLKQNQFSGTQQLFSHAFSKYVN